MSSLRGLGVGCIALLGVALAAACGPAFHVSEETPGFGGDGGQGWGGEPTASGAGDGGSSAGVPSGGDAGAGGAAAPLTRCEQLQGFSHAHHCYIDVTTESLPQPTAAMACDVMATTEDVAGGLLALNDAAEQTFVLRQFLEDFTDRSDAWLALTCDEGEHPDVSDCSCSQCTPEQLLDKQTAWGWADGTKSSFGWVNGNPNNAYRCAALGYNPENMTWGWVDRPCDKISIAPIADHPHTYRTICELEL